MNSADQLIAAVGHVRACGSSCACSGSFGVSIAFEAVCMAAETLIELMDSPATIEWCDHHGRPHEFCQLIDAASCVPRVRAVGPEVALWTGGQS